MTIHPTQSNLFPAGDDLPLFSGAPVRVDDNLFLPAAEACKRIIALIDDLDGDPTDPRQLTLDETNALLTEIYSICDTAGERPAIDPTECPARREQTIMQTNAPAGPALSVAIGKFVVITGPRCSKCSALLGPGDQSTLCAYCFNRLNNITESDEQPPAPAPLCGTCRQPLDWDPADDMYSSPFSVPLCASCFNLLNEMHP